MKNLKKALIFVFILTLVLGCFNSIAFAGDFPTKPIKMIVYTSPGGLIDVTTRKFVDIAAKYTDTTFVVENKPGAGGLVGLKDVLNKPADGYTVFAGTKSNISKVVASEGDVNLFDFDWIAMLMEDPECIILKKDSEIDTYEKLVQDAKEKDGDQIWVGPAAGGLDHVFGMMFCEKAGIEMKWIPYSSGGKARAALLGDMGVAYVGNPRDTAGSDEFVIAAVSAEERLEQFPDVPTFNEFGIEGLDNEYMWRGFAVKEGTPREAKDFICDIVKKVTDDSEWREYWEKYGINVSYTPEEEFEEIIKNDEKVFTHYLKNLGVIE